MSKQTKIEDIIFPQRDVILCEKNLIKETEAGIILIDKFSYTEDGAVKQGTSSISPDPVYKVLSVGPDVQSCKPGDYIMMVANSQATFIDLIDEERHFMIREMNVAFTVHPMYKKVQEEYKKNKEKKLSEIKEKSKKEIIN